MSMKYAVKINCKDFVLSYGFCSQSLQVWSKCRLYLSHCLKSKSCVMSIKPFLLLLIKVFLGLQLFEVVGPDVQQLFWLSR